MNNATQALDLFGLNKADVPIVRDSATGAFVAFKFDLLKPGRNYFDLSEYTNAMQGEAGFRTPVFLTMNGVPLVKDENTDITIKGNDPRVTNSQFNVIPSVITSGTGFYNIDWPAHTFQAAGAYTFHIEVSKGGNVYKTAPCVLDVEPDMVTMATDFKDGISPYDSEFEAMRAKIRQELTDIDNQIQTTADLAKQISSNVDGLITGALADVPKLDQNNTYTGVNLFGDINAKNIKTDTLSIDKSLLLNGQDITQGLIRNTASLHGTPINGITWFYANCFKLSMAQGVLAIMDMEFNVPNNSMFQNATANNPVPVFQFPKGSLSGLGGTPFAIAGGLLCLNTASDTLDFCGVTNGWANWGTAIRGYVPVYAMYNS